MIRLIDPVTFVVPGTAGARALVVVEKFGAELRRAPAQFHHCLGGQAIDVYLDKCAECPAPKNVNLKKWEVWGASSPRH